MTFRLTPIALAILLLGTQAAALAQQAGSAPLKAEPAAAASPEIAKVDVKGAYDPRSDDTASKTVIGRAEILKYGDTNVFDVLKRAPGVTVIGNSIRMRGLGNGYTQVLVNGERPPPGFSMDALTPEQIEKIEVIRAATAEHSMQAIAGTINIVLTRVVSKPQRDLRINAGGTRDKRNTMLFGTIADRKGQLSYYLNAALGHKLDKAPILVTESFTLPDGRVSQLRDGHTKRDTSSTMFGMQPRLNWKFANDDQLNASAFVQAVANDTATRVNYSNRIGSFGHPDYVRRDGDVDNRVRFFGADLNWVAKLAGGKLDAKISGSRGRSQVGQRYRSASGDGATVLLRQIDSVQHFINVGSTGKYTRTLGAGHALSTGWEVERQGTEEDLLRRDALSGRAPAIRPEVYDPTVTKLAAYAQDEWNITKAWSMYLGARWEQIRTHSEGSGLLTSESRNRVLSPVAQTLYKFPDQSGRQLRMALTRTFKAPDINQLSARRNESDSNSIFNPDTSGNPNLLPELANGVDLSYEHFWAPGAVFSVGTSARHIKDYIRTRLAQDSRGDWLYQPLNDGSADVRTLDVELKFPLKAVLKDGAPFDLRASINRNWSKVESVPGPDNRLDKQTPLSASFGVDYKVDQYSAGASFAYRRGGLARVSEREWSRQQTRRDLEAYLLYKVRTGLQLRVSASNLLGQDDLNEARYDDENGVSQNWSVSSGSPRLQANLEIKF